MSATEGIQSPRHNRTIPGTSAGQLIHALLIASLSLGFATARQLYSYEAGFATLEDLVSLTGPLPFQGRLLVPAILRYSIEAGLISTPQSGVLIIDTISMIAILSATSAILHGYGVTSQRWFTVVLPALFLLFPYFAELSLNILYPADIPSVAFLALSVYLLRRSQPGFVTALVIFASFNRETALAIPLLTLTLLSRESRGSRVQIALFQTGIFIICRAAVSWFLGRR